MLCDRAIRGSRWKLASVRKIKSQISNLKIRRQRRRSNDAAHGAVPLLVVTAFIGVGCQQHKPAMNAMPQHAMDADRAAETALDQETADTAAIKVAALAPVDDLSTRREIDLHVALYRAAYHSNVGDFTRHFVLESVPEDPQEPAISISQHEFQLRVLAALNDLGVPMAWAAATRPGGDVEYFPGTYERATRLRIRINQRIEDQATVQAEVGDWTANVGSSRQAVIAVWDGETWAVQRDRVRLVW
jgi:hypothetical protein